MRRRGLPTLYADLAGEWENLRHAGQILRARLAREAGALTGLQLRKLSTWPLPGTDSESVLLEIRPRGV